MKLIKGSNKSIFHQVDPSILKSADSRRSHIQGLKALGSLWNRGLLPNDLENHFFITWLAYVNGNVFSLSSTLGLHRNTLINIFKHKAKKSSTYKLRKIWLQINSAEKTDSFSERVFRFYHRVIKAPKFSRAENKALANLWLMGMTRKAIRSHFVFWFSRRGEDIKKTSKRMGLNYRTLRRYRAYAAGPNSPAAKWLKPLRPKKKDWYPLGFGGRKKGY